MAIGRVNTGGGGTGGSLTVTAPAGVTVKVSKDGKTYTKTTNSAGKATFNGLKTGTWTVTISNGGQTATQSVVVNADYAVTMAFFAATINITYPAGSTCTCSDGTTILTAPDTSGTWACVVGNTGTWTVTATDGDKTKSQTVNVTSETTYNVTITFELYIFKSGVGLYSGLTGFSNATYNSDKIVAKSILGAGSGKGDAVISKEKIDVTQYKTATFSGINCNFSGNGNANSSYIYAFVGGASTTIGSATTSGSATLASNKTVTVDISNVTGPVEFGFKTYSNAAYSVSFKDFNLNGIVFS